jgi:hypothetical protein
VSLLPAILGLLDITNNTWSAVSTTAQNFVNVIKQVPNVVTAVALPAAFPLLSVVNGLAATAEEVVKAANAGDTEGAVSALVNAPATLTDAFLNGKGTILGFIPVPGLLSPSSPLGALGSGPIASLLDIPKTIAGALDPNPLAPVTSSATATSAKLAARSVTLSVPAAETDSAKTSADAATESTSAATGSDADSQDDGSTTTATKASPATKTATKTAVKKPSATASPATKIRDNIKKATQRFAGKTGKGSSAAGSSDSSASSAAKSSHKRGGDHKG